MQNRFKTIYGRTTRWVLVTKMKAGVFAQIYITAYVGS